MLSNVLKIPIQLHLLRGVEAAVLDAFRRGCLWNLVESRQGCSPN